MRRAPRLGEAPKRRLASLAILGVVVVVAAAALGFALNELTGGGHDEERQVARRQRPPTPETQALLPAGGEPKTKDGTQGAAQRPTRSLLLQWPPDLPGHTVVLLNTSDRTAARRGAARQSENLGIRYPGAYVQLVDPVS